MSETKLNWKMQRDHEERGHSIDSIKQSIEDRKPDFDTYIDAQKKKADAQKKIDDDERGHSINPQKKINAQKNKKADPEKKNVIDPQKNSIDPQKKKADVIIQVPRAHAMSLFRAHAIPQFVRHMQCFVVGSQNLRPPKT
jgi:uridine kinase